MIRRPLIVAALVLVGSAIGDTQPRYSSLETCLADSSSGRDRKELAKWIFLAMAAHPEIKQFVVPTAADAAEESSKAMGALVTRLVADSCANETRTAVKTGGTAALEMAFQRLGQLAMQELMTDKAVAESTGRFERYLDQEKLGKLMGGK